MQEIYRSNWKAGADGAPAQHGDRAKYALLAAAHGGTAGSCLVRFRAQGFFLFQSLDLGLEVLVFMPLGGEVSLRQPQALGDTGGGEQVGNLLQLGVRAAEVFHLDRALVEQGVDEEIGLAKTDTELLGQFALGDVGVPLDGLEDAEMGLFFGGHG